VAQDKPGRCILEQMLMSLIETPSMRLPLQEPLALVPKPVLRPDITVEHMSLTEALREKIAWRKLVDAAIDDNPFLSPAVIEPAARHLTDDGSLSIAGMWRNTSRGRKLAGLAVLTNRRRKYAGALMGGADALLFSHPLIPMGGILLAEPPEVASTSFRELIKWLGNRWPRPKYVVLPRIETTSLLATLTMTDALASGVVLRRRPEMRHSHGFDIPFDAPAISMANNANDISIIRTQREIIAATEQLLTLDALVTERGLTNPMLVEDPRLSGFLRSAVRGLAQEGRVHLAVMDGPSGRAGAIAVLGRSRAYLWWVMGPSGRDPMIQANLAAALARSTGLPMMSAASQPLAGFGTQPLVTETLSLGLDQGVGGLVRRIRERMT
jgi:hypothetical protein